MRALWMAVVALGVGLFGGCRYQAKCTDPCSEATFASGPGDSVTCCPNQRAEAQLGGGVICRCPPPVPPSERAK